MGQQNVARARRSTCASSDRSTLAAARDRTNDGADHSPNANFRGIGAGGSWSLFDVGLRANLNVLAIGGGESNERELQARNAFHTRGLSDFNYTAFDAGAAFGDNPSVDDERCGECCEELVTRLIERGRKRFADANRQHRSGSEGDDIGYPSLN